MNELSLFTGAGGGILGSKLLGWQTIGSLEDIRNRSDLPEPIICGGNDGVANRANRTRAVGNGQVPLTMAAAYAILSSNSYQ